MAHRSYDSMKPSANKMLSKRWDDAKMKSHRDRVKKTKPMVDTTPPKTYMHVQVKLKKLQQEEERLATIERDNRLLLEKMHTIMKTGGRIDNRNDYDHKSLNRSKRQQELVRITHENQAILKRIQSKQAQYDRERWEKDHVDSQQYKSNITRFPEKQSQGRTTRRRSSGTESSRPQKKAPEEKVAPYKGKGTVRPAPKFNADNGATILRNAMEGFGTDEATIVEVLGSCTFKQRQAMAKAYKKKYKRDLDEDLKSELSGNLEKLVTALMMGPTAHDAACLRDATEGAGTDEGCLIEILASRDNDEIAVTKGLYEKNFGSTLEEDIKSDTGGFIETVLLSLASGKREADSVIDRDGAKESAQKLHDAGEGQWGTDESEFQKIIMTSSPSQLNAISEEYENLTGHDLLKAIDSEMDGDLQTALQALVQSARGKPQYFASILAKATDGSGTDDDALIRTVASRSENDMAEIKQAYSAAEGKALAETIKSETSGDYGDLLLLLIGEGQKVTVWNAQPKKRKDEFEDIADYEGTGTVVAATKNYDPKTGAELLHKAMDGMGTDEDTIVKVLGSTTIAQRQAIAKEYRNLYDKDLKDHLESELSGDFEDLCTGLLMNTRDYEAKCLHDAISGAGTDEKACIEILASRSNEDVEAIAAAYKKAYGASLEEDITGDTSGIVRTIMLNCVTGKRQTGGRINKTMAAEAAKALQKAGEGKWGTDESAFYKIVSTSSAAQINATAAEYQTLTGKSLVEAIGEEFSGDEKECLSAVVESSTGLPEFFAKRLNGAIEGVGTDEKTLRRIITSRCEVDTTEIKNSYRYLYQKDLADDIEKDVGGNLKDLLLLLLGANSGADVWPAPAADEAQEGDKIISVKERSVEAPTMRANPSFDQEEAVKDLRAAMKGLGTNEGKLIAALTSCDTKQRLALIPAYKKAHDRDLIKDIKSEIGGDFEDALVGLLQTTTDFEAWCLHEAISGAGTDENCISEILATRTPKELAAISSSYKAQFDSDLVADIKGDVGGQLQKIYEGILSRNDSSDVNVSAAERTANALKEKFDDEVVSAMLADESPAQLKAVAEEYEQISGKTLESLIRDEMKGDQEDALAAIVSSAVNMQDFFAAQLNRAMSGMGTNEATLTRIIVSRAEKDLGAVKSSYEKLYGKNLIADVQKETGGDYEKTLVALLQ